MSERVGGDHLAAGDRAQGAPGNAVDAVLDEPDRPVAHQAVDAAGVIAVGREGGVGRASLVLVGRDDVVGVGVAGQSE